ncbi:AraC family transcriptional regulator [Maribacter sp.]|uniref:AraC family transcriptional regulator n=1 Tax=Maribacter sp. TaxID=1897614 RepID=UPI0025BC7369|nr:AraC family transcriptional regulator [Maribacter sp.]
MKIYPFKIPKPKKKNLIIQVDEGSSFYDKLHQHEEIQISLIIQGKGKLIIADSIHPFTNGDIFIIGSQCPHLFQNTNKSLSKVAMISIFFTKNSFGKQFFLIPEMKEIRSFFEQSDKGFSPISKISSINKLILSLPKANPFDRFLTFFKLLKKLRKCKTKTLTHFVYPKEISNNEGNRMQLVYTFVLDNFQNEISLEHIAHLAYMTPNSFCRFFKQRTNKTFFQFLIELRVEHACQLLNSPKGKSISEISFASGFKSISNFNRKFKSIKGVTPSNYILSLNSNS